MRDIQLHMFCRCHKQRDPILTCIYQHMFWSQDQHKKRELKDTFGHKSMWSYLQTIHRDSQDCNTLKWGLNILQTVQRGIERHTAWFNHLCRCLRKGYNLIRIFFVSNQHNTHQNIHQGVHIFQ